jgi:alpha-tubulin suppressor-like RCC1 family protein
VCDVCDDAVDDSDVLTPDAPTDDSSTSLADVGADIAEIDMGPDVQDAPPSPIDVNGVVVMKQVSASVYHTCGLHNDGTVICWGRNSFGESTPPFGTFFSQIDAGDYFTCGLVLDGTIACWGSNNYGQVTAPAGEFSQVASGSDHACGLKIDGSVTCWGYNCIVSVQSAGRHIHSGFCRFSTHVRNQDQRHRGLLGQQHPQRDDLQSWGIFRK